MKRFLGVLLLAGGGLSWAGGVVAQQAPDPADAPTAATAFLEAVRAGGFSAEADHLHPDELARFQAMLLPVLEADQARGRVLLNATFGRDATLTDARTAEPADFMRRFTRIMAVRMPEQPVGFDELEVLGSIPEDPMFHVLVRLRTISDAAAVEELRVVTLMPYEGTWKVRMGSDLEAAVRQMLPSEAKKRPSPRLVPSPEPPPSKPSVPGRSNE